MSLITISLLFRYSESDTESVVGSGFGTENIWSINPW